MTDDEKLLLLATVDPAPAVSADLGALVEIPETPTAPADDWFTSGLDESGIDNSGAIVILNDGVTMSYDDWIAAGQPNPDPDNVPEQADIAAPSDASFDAAGWADHRRESISVVGMTHMGLE